MEQHPQKYSTESVSHFQLLYKTLLRLSALPFSTASVTFWHNYLCFDSYLESERSFATFRLNPSNEVWVRRDAVLRPGRGPPTASIRRSCSTHRMASAFVPLIRTQEERRITEDEGGGEEEDDIQCKKNTGSRCVAGMGWARRESMQTRMWLRRCERCWR